MHPLFISIYPDIFIQPINSFWEVRMQWMPMAAVVVLCGGVAFASVGGGDITMKNDGGDTVFNHETWATAIGIPGPWT